MSANSDLADALARERGIKAEAAFRRAMDHGVGTEECRAYIAQGFHWLRAKRAAENGDTTPRPYGIYPGRATGSSR